MAVDPTAQPTSDAGKTAEEAAAATAAAAAAKAAKDGTPASTPEEKAAADAAATADAAKKAEDARIASEAAKPKAPDSYTLKVPDEAKRLASDKVLERISAIAKANDWTNEEAQAALDEHLETVTTELTARVSTLLAETKADPTYGKDNFPQTQKHVDRGIDAIMPEGHPMRERFLRDLKDSGGDVNLPFVAFLAMVGEKVSEDTPGRGRSAPAQHRDGQTATKFYDHPTSIALEEATKGT